MNILPARNSVNFSYNLTICNHHFLPAITQVKIDIYALFTVILLSLELMVSSQLTVGAAVFSAVRCATPAAWLCLGLQ